MGGTNKRSVINRNAAVYKPFRKMYTMVEKRVDFSVFFNLTKINVFKILLCKTFASVINVLLVDFFLNIFVVLKN